VVALQNIAVQSLARIPFAYKRASGPFPQERFARFVNSATRQLNFYSAAGFFDCQGA
jgi:hypothetical protein